MLASGLLSPRQSEIVRLAASGMTDKEIAAHMGISTGTIRSHWDRLRERLGAASRGEAIALLGEDARMALVNEVALLQRAMGQGRLLAWAARADGFVDYVSASFEAFCGRPAAALVGAGCRALMPECQLGESATRWRRANAEREGYEASVLFENAVGAFVPYLIRIAPLETLGAHVARWMGTASPVLAEPAPEMEAELVSPLSGLNAVSEPCGPAHAPGRWRLVREDDGTRYVASARWLRSGISGEPPGPDRRQALLAARHYADRGQVLAIVPPEDVEVFEDSGTAVLATAWLLRR